MEGTTKIISVIRSLLVRMRAETEQLGVTYVYDYVPEEKNMPFITIGEVSTKDDGNKYSTGEYITIDIEIWSKNKGKYKDLLTAKKIQQLLSEELTPEANEEEYEVITQDTKTIVSRELDYGIFLTIIQLKIRIE